MEDAILLEDSADVRLTDTHGCSAYSSPENLSSHVYSGRSADVWSLGVILYSLLFKGHPFQDTDASQVVDKIRRGVYTVPDSVSSQARCLVRSLLRTEPAERLSVFEAVKHPWFALDHSSEALSLNVSALSKGITRGLDQRVPECEIPQREDSFPRF